jgi:hypothetical protein
MYRSKRAAREDWSSTRRKLSMTRRSHARAWPS